MWTNEELLEKIQEQQEMTAKLIGQLTPDDHSEELLEKVIAKQREIDHQIDSIIESGIDGTDTSPNPATEPVDIAEPDVK